MWVSYLHHLSTHFPIVMSLVLAVVGGWYVRSPHRILLTFLRWAGWATMLLTSVALVSGLFAAPEWWTSDGTDALSHHRNLGILLWCVVMLATGFFEVGVIQDRLAFRKLGALMWTVSFVAVLGAGHWGGSMMHSDRVPWQGTEPTLGYHVDVATDAAKEPASESNTNGK